MARSSSRTSRPRTSTRSGSHSGKPASGRGQSTAARGRKESAAASRSRKKKRTETVLITGACGFIGRALVEELVQDSDDRTRILALDIREDPQLPSASNLRYLSLDIRDPELEDVLRREGVTRVVHLASIVDAKGMGEETAYSIDVGGSENLLRGCVVTGVRQIIVTSSGAAYGYHRSNARPLRETDPLRGNDEFAYSRHKRIIEEMLADYREAHPDLKQLIFRPGTVLGDGASNQITALFEKRIIPGVLGSESPFVFIWDRDVVQCIIRGLKTDASGVYNLAGDGFLPMHVIAERMGGFYLPLPAFAIQSALFILKKLGLSRYGPEQVRFLQYRPVLSNDRLKREFGYQPALNSEEVFELYRRNRRADA